MTYEPLHHKYRPQTFAELVGQEAIAATLIHAIQQQRIAPAYLFTGARGTGKTSSARILAKSLNCLKSKTPTENPCGVCDVCQAIARGSALDVIEIDAASNTGVDNIRELIERAQFAPVQCRYKVYIIDEVHMLSTAAFNALLKTLEEPPDRVVFVLATTDPQRVLPTIISRCQRFDYRRIPLDAMTLHLRKIADLETISIADTAITLIGQIAQGGLRDAESLLDQLSLLTGEIDVDRIWDLVGSVPERDLLELVEAIAQDHPEAVLDSTRRLMDRGREPLIVLQNLASFYRDLLIAKTAPQRNDLVAITPPTWQKLCDLANHLDIGTILAGQQHLRSAEVQVKNTTQPRLWLEVTLMGLLPSALLSRDLQSGHSAPATSVARSRPPAPAPAKPAAPPQAAHPPISSHLSPSHPAPLESAPTVAPPTPAAIPEPSPEEVPNLLNLLPPLPEPLPEEPDVSDGSTTLGGMWQDIIREIKPYSTQVMVRQQCHLIGFDGQQARLGVSSQPLFKMAQGKVPNIEAALAKIFDRKIQVSLEVATPIPGQSGESPPASAPPPEVPPPNDQRPQQYRNEPPQNLPPTPRANESPAPSPPGEPPAPSPYSQGDPEESRLGDKPDFSQQPASDSWQVDEVTKAAKQLADFFAGKVVDMGDGFDLPATETEAIAPAFDLQLDPASTWNEPGEEDTEADLDNDDDVPF